MEITADSAPVIKPASLPKYIAVRTTIAVTGLKPGSGVNRMRPTTDSATIAAMRMSVCVLPDFLSKCRKKGTQASSATQSEIHAYCFSANSSVPPTTTAGVSRQRTIQETHFFAFISKF